MNRRRFFSLLGAAAAAAVVDPEKLLWTPGERTHILPPANGWKPGPLEWFRDPELELLARARRRAFEMQRVYHQLQSERLEAIAFYSGDQWEPFVTLPAPVTDLFTVDDRVVAVCDETLYEIKRDGSYETLRRGRTTGLYQS